MFWNWIQGVYKSSYTFYEGTQNYWKFYCYYVPILDPGGLLKVLVFTNNL